MAVAAAMRVLYLFDYHDHSVYWGAMLLDAEIHDEWARQLSSGAWLGGNDVFTLPPLYPYFLAVLYTIAGASYPVVYITQAALGLTSLWLIHSIGAKAFGERVAVIATALAALYGSFMFMESKLMSTTLAVTLGLTLIRLLLAAGERQTLTLWGCCGALLGITALARPEVLLFAPLAGLWIRRVTKRPDVKRSSARIDQYALAGRQSWFALSVFAVFIVVAVAPATLRNWVVTGDWSLSNLISSQAGITFYQSNNARGNGLYIFLSKEGFSGNAKTQAAEEKQIAEKQAGRELKRSEVTRHWMAKGFDWILGNPGRFLLLEGRKLQRFLGSYEYSTEYILYVERETVRSLWLAPIPFGLITALGGAGLVMQYRKGFPQAANLLALFVLANLLGVLAFYVSSRYRMPAAPFLILFAAVAIERIASSLRSPIAAQRTEAIVYGVIVLVLFPVLHFQVDQSSRIQEANTHYNIGNLWFNGKQYDNAIGAYQRALGGDKTNWRAWYNMGNALHAAGRTPEALEAWRETLKRNPAMDGAKRNLQRFGKEAN